MVVFSLTVVMATLKNTGFENNSKSFPKRKQKKKEVTEDDEPPLIP
jgi:hypothetical protein